jgi:hypothetical protein
MSSQLKPGDRVRLTTFLRVEGYQPGATGMVWRGPIPRSCGGAYFLVTMDGDKSIPPGLVLTDDEIERDMSC